jgi:DNA polymerase-3 subunit alpha
VKTKQKSLVVVERRAKEDFYMEVMRHNQEDENRVNTTLISLARKHEVKIVATNNTFYIERNANAHDILLCVVKVKTNDTNRSWSWLSFWFA